MGQVYPNKVKELSRLPGLKAVLRAEAETMAARSAAILAAHSKGPHGGTSPTISVVSGTVDSYVVMDDPDGGVLAIEFGRSGARPMAPIAPLRGGMV